MLPLREQILHIPPFNVRLRSPISAVWRHIEFFYANYQTRPEGTFVDFDIQLLPGRGLRKIWRPQVRFLIDGTEPFLPLPSEQAAPLFEWGLNWGVASRSLGYLVMHAAVLATEDKALMLPGFPGAGKSTLCASLALLDGWRLLSDELAILDPVGGELLGHPRPISLKNESIEVVRGFDSVRIGRVYHDTRKGTVTHAAVPELSIQQAEQPAMCRWVVFPRFTAGVSASFEEISRAEAFALISEQSFNNERMGEVGFHALCQMLSGSRCFLAEYGSTQDGLALIRDICAE